ncbi:MAG: hypothetical protein PHT44_03565 [Candidatus Portnoybacteria bacterium]|nr:hypothetical protein [Candidatus Portnoybacteria bacterium]MDD4983094.1 hypothetical protein [Candidatus Portnoybacteria bacterium]
MKKIFLVSMAIFIAFGFLAGSASAAVRVRGYIKPSTGRYVAPSYRSSPNKSIWDNYSTKGNYNPYTGKKGSVSPYKSFKW